MNIRRRLSLFCHPAALRLFLRTHRLFRSDPRYSPLNLLKAVWLAADEDKIVRHEGKWVYSSFLPPIPSRAALQVLLAMPDTHGLFDAQVTGQRLAPISMYLAVTERCPYQCAHCCAVGRNPVPDLSTQQMKKLLSELQEMGTAIIGLTGGEPLLREDLCELISSIDDRSVTILFTSGYGLTLDRARNLKKAGLFAAGISLDSADAGIMDARRGRTGAFEQAVQAIQYCRQAGLYTMAQTVAGRDSLRSGSLQQIVTLAGKLGAHEVRVMENMPSGRLAKITPDRILTAQDRQELCAFHAVVNRQKHLPKVSVFAHTEDAQRYGCGAGTQHSYIDAAGNLYPCDFVPLSFGNIHDRPITALWRDMHRRIGKPRQTCMIMELFSKNLLAGVETFPVAPAQTEDYIRKLDVMDRMPGFYRHLLGKGKRPANHT